MSAHTSPAVNTGPDNRVYWKIGGILAVLTIIEVACIYMESMQNYLALILIGIGIIKFILVAMYFMHLKGDAPIYTVFFVIGAVMAIAIFVGLLAMNPPPATDLAAAGM